MAEITRDVFSLTDHCLCLRWFLCPGAGYFSYICYSCFTFHVHTVSNFL